ncbi:MAG: beta-N-acetylhexosaminidase [Hydrogenophilus sp.]|nr:beta-N-acetylhexosaminidase [Hydrogenophilus sp.]
MKQWWIGLEGTSVTTADRRRLRHPSVGGVVLFSRNVEGGTQLRRLIEEVRAIRPDVAVAVDQEGGRVQRLRGEGFSALPPLREIGAVWERNADEAVRWARRVGEQIGAELAAHGVTVALGPVVDVDKGVSSVIGDRSFGGDPVAVATLGWVMAEAIAAKGVMPVLKHFPGHGGSSEDTHQSGAVDPRPWREVWACDLVPYRIAVALGGKIGIMASWVQFPTCDAAPAGFSRFWLQEVLRERVGFKGLVVSDDLSMAAAEWGGASLQERGEAFFAAGGEVALACHDFAAIDGWLSHAGEQNA